MLSDKPNLPEHWNAVTSRRAEAMRQHFDMKPRTSPGPQQQQQQPPEFNRQVAVPAPPPAAAEAGVDWQRIVEILKKRWRLSVAFALVVLVSTAVVTLTMRPIFEPQARLEVDPPGAEVFSLQGNNNAQASTDYMETQAQNLQNDELTLEVIRKMRLDRSPYFGADPYAVAVDPRLAKGAAIPLTPAESRALAVLKDSRQVTRDAASRLITVSVAAHDPQVAAEVTNNLVSLFIDRDYKLRNEAISQSSQWLQRQLEDIHQRMENSNLALNDFEKTHGMSMIGDSQSRFSEEMVELSRQTMQAQADRIQLQSFLQHLSGAPNHPLPQVSSDPVIQELTKRLADVKGQIAETRVIYGASHPNTKKLQNQADELQAELTKQSAQILGDLKANYAAAQARERSMQSQLDGASKRMVVLAQYNALKKEADANTQLYQALYQKIKEAAIAAETKSSNIRVVDRARVLDRPTRPHRQQNMAAGLALGLFGGIVVAFLREGFETRIRTPEDMKRCLGGGSISVIPVLRQDQAIAQGVSSQRSRLHGSDSKANLFQIERPHSPEGEALRSIGISVRLSRQNDRAPQVLMIASPLKGEGKTTVAVNLALTLARHGKTCIVDADLRTEGVAPVLGVHAEYGIREVLSGAITLEEVVKSGVKLPTLSLLAPGSEPGVAGELISSHAMGNLIGVLRQRFEYVVIDSPPVLMFSDARALGVLADGIIMVGRAGVTTRASLKRAMELLSRVRSAPVIDLVLNAADYPAGVYRDYHGYGVAV